MTSSACPSSPGPPSDAQLSTPHNGTALTLSCSGSSPGGFVGDNCDDPSPERKSSWHNVTTFILGSAGFLLHLIQCGTTTLRNKDLKIFFILIQITVKTGNPYRCFKKYLLISIINEKLPRQHFHSIFTSVSLPFITDTRKK